VDPSWLTAAVALAVAVVGCAGWLLRIAWRGARRVTHFLDDYNGEPARDGLPAKPGFMARLASVEKALEHVVQETSPNHGRSLRDIVIRTASDVADIKAEQAAVKARLDIFEQRGGNTP
jgi:hypothetical protein